MSSIRVACFVVKNKYFDKHAIERLHKSFGFNIPKYLQYEGGTGLNYLCCVDSKVEIDKICDIFHFEYSRPFYEMDINKKYYTNEYIIHPTYKKDGPKFLLRKLIEN